MAANDSTEGLMTARGRLDGTLVLWVCGGAAAMFVSTQAVAWGLAALRTWYLAMLSTMFLSTR